MGEYPTLQEKAEVVTDQIPSQKHKNPSLNPDLRRNYDGNGIRRTSTRRKTMAVTIPSQFVTDLRRKKIRRNL